MTPPLHSLLVYDFILSRTSLNIGSTSSATQDPVKELLGSGWVSRDVKKVWVSYARRCWWEWTWWLTLYVCLFFSCDFLIRNFLVNRYYGFVHCRQNKTCINQVCHSCRLFVCFAQSGHSSSYLWSSYPQSFTWPSSSRKFSQNHKKVKFVHLDIGSGSGPLLVHLFISDVSFSISTQTPTLTTW